MPVCPAHRDFTFIFKYGGSGSQSKLTVPVPIQLGRQTVSELVNRLAGAHNLPCYILPDLSKQLEEFIAVETKKSQDASADDLIQKVKNGDINISKVVDRWTKVYSQEVVEYTKPEVITNEQVFSEVYHGLIHSSALEYLLNLEHTYALSIEEIIKQRDLDLSHLEQRQSEEMEQAVVNVGTAYTDEQVNQLAQRHFENMQLIESKWASELSNLQETQKREYRDWVMKVHEDSQTTKGAPAYVHRVRALSNSMTAGDEDMNPQVTRMEESFTIHLGAQMKTMHNLRLVCADVLDLCRHKTHTIGGVVVPQPQRLQTAMSLYSNNLCGLVLMVDNRLNSYTGIKREFAKVCQQSTDFHFYDLEKQFANVEQDLLRANDWRTQLRAQEDGDRISVKSSASSGSADKDIHARMSTGDFYITRHSNLSEVHIVFHLVIDPESVKAADLSSRHPIILGYRNILKACFRHDVKTITLPLLLVHEMSEEMTIPWCMKRAELVFKCVKGFTMELASWGGQESRIIQFLVPKGLSEETFSAISNMLPSIFRMSNPVVAKKS